MCTKILSKIIAAAFKFSYKPEKYLDKSEFYHGVKAFFLTPK